MELVAVCASSVAAAFVAYALYVRRPAASGPPTPVHRTLLDPLDALSAVRLVSRLCESETNSFELASRLLWLYTLFAPAESSMRALSMEQQRLCGTGGAEEFAVTTAYFAMMMAVSEVVEVGPRPVVKAEAMRRVASVGVLGPSPPPSTSTRRRPPRRS